MEPLFYIAAAVTVLATLRVITHVHAVHALLYLVVALIALALIFYLLGAQFAAALEIIIYGGAIMVLFIFVVMLLGPLADGVDGRHDRLAVERHGIPIGWAIGAAFDGSWTGASCFGADGKLNPASGCDAFAPRPAALHCRPGRGARGRAPGMAAAPDFHRVADQPLPRDP